MTTTTKTASRIMDTALTLAADGRRRNGRWKRDSLPTGNGESANISTWQARMKEAGAVLDHAPDLAPLVVTGELALSAAFEQAENAAAIAAAQKARNAQASR